MEAKHKLKEILRVLAAEALREKGMRNLLIQLSIREWKECSVLNQYYQEAKEYLKDCESGVFPWSEQDIKAFATDDILNKLLAKVEGGEG